MELRPYEDGDLELTEALETDPGVMRQLGGPIERARLPEIHRRRRESMHAFPPVTNAPSNALCRKFGFTLLGQRDFVYAGRTLRCNHWVLPTGP